MVQWGTRTTSSAHSTLTFLAAVAGLHTKTSACSREFASRLEVLLLAPISQHGHVQRRRLLIGLGDKTIADKCKAFIAGHQGNKSEELKELPHLIESSLFFFENTEYEKRCNYYGITLSKPLCRYPMDDELTHLRSTIGSLTRKCERTTITTLGTSKSYRKPNDEGDESQKIRFL